MLMTLIKYVPVLNDKKCRIFLPIQGLRYLSLVPFNTCSLVNKSSNHPFFL